MNKLNAECITFYTETLFVLTRTAHALLMFIHLPLDWDRVDVTWLLFDHEAAGRCRHISGWLCYTRNLGGAGGAAVLQDHSAGGRWKSWLLAVGGNVWGGSCEKTHCKERKQTKAYFVCYISIISTVTCTQVVQTLCFLDPTNQKAVLLKEGGATTASFTQKMNWGAYNTTMDSCKLWNMQLSVSRV